MIIAILTLDCWRVWYEIGIGSVQFCAIHVNQRIASTSEQPGGLMHSAEFCAQCKINQISLTNGRSGAILYARSTRPHGSRNPYRTGVDTPLQGVFLCPKFNMAFSRVDSIMVGLSGQHSVLAATCSRFSTPFKSAAHAVESIGGGYSLLRTGLPA